MGSLGTQGVQAACAARDSPGAARRGKDIWFPIYIYIYIYIYTHAIDYGHTLYITHPTLLGGVGGGRGGVGGGVRHTSRFVRVILGHALLLCIVSILTDDHRREFAVPKSISVSILEIKIKDR